MSLRRLLLIDDEEPILVAMSDYFGLQGYEVDCARGLDEATHLLAAGTYSVVITDLRLEGGDAAQGLEIVSRVRERHPRTHCIVLTAYGSAQEETEARKRGVKAFLHKPKSLPELAGSVAGLLETAPPSSISSA